jgi:molybdate transport system substrate-binding protein
VVLASATSLVIESAASARASGTVNVLYAGSLFDLMQRRLAPAFHRATGYSVAGFSAGSTALASEIRGRTVVGDVFISASPTVNATLEGAANGAWVSSYTEFGRSPLVLGYNRGSRFAAALASKPWYSVIVRPGFLLGRTDPATDPKGVLAVKALDRAAAEHHDPALRALARSTSNVYPETTLVGRLQAGQLDAGFFYAVEAVSAHLATVPLTGTAYVGRYTVAVLNRAPHAAAARAFVRFLLGASGRRILEQYGITPQAPPKVVASTSSPRVTRAAGS